MKIITLFFLVLTLSSCSFSGPKNEDVLVSNDDLEFAVDTLADTAVNADFQVEEQKVTETVVPDEHQAPPVAEEEAMKAPEEPKFGDFQKPVDAPVEISVAANAETTHSYGPMETYRVQKGDTMMMVAFKIYGDYRKWKDLRAWNQDVLKVKEGVELKYQVPDSKFEWMPSGLPYLVKTGDTLQVVSLDKYGTAKKWRSIYNNNRPLIKNPDLIFAGFTIYYQPTRELASEKK